MYRVQEFAKLTGVTVRALHHYDRLGLLVPQRQMSSRRDRPGQRVYTDRDLRRLEPIVALRTLGFSLHQIRVLMGEARTPLRQALRVQRELLTAKRDQLDRALTAIGQALAQPRPDASLLRQITQELRRMPENTNWTDKYYSASARAFLASRQPAFTAEMQEEVSRQWAELIADVEAALGEDPASTRVQALAARWRTLIEGFTQRDPDIQSGLRKVWVDRANWPSEVRQETTAFRPEIMAFMGRALRVRA